MRYAVEMSSGGMIYVLSRVTVTLDGVFGLDIGFIGHFTTRLGTAK
jgi:hypothetical protein